MSKSCFGIAAVLLLFVVGIVGFFTLLFGGIYYATSGIVESADGFLSSVANGNDVGARNFLSSGFSSTFSDEEFESLVAEKELAQYESVFWNNRSIENSTGELEGNFTTKTGGTVPLHLFFVKEDGSWKIENIGQDISVKSDSQTPSPKSQKVAREDSSEERMELAEEAVLTIKDIPDSEHSESLVKKWTIEFSDGVSKKDFTEFHSQTSYEFQEQISIEEFTKIFSGFVEKEIDLSWIKGVTPVFKRAPSLDIDGVLEMVGHFPAQPPLTFEYSFVRRAKTWKPIAINLRVKQLRSGELTNVDEAAELIFGKTVQFGNSIGDGDFAEFHAATARKFQKQFSLDQFTEVFKPFIEKKADLAWIGKTRPLFDFAPSLNTDGLLSMRGHFPAEPRVNFKYSFIHEDSQWKVISVDISIPAEDAGDDGKEQVDTKSPNDE